MGKIFAAAALSLAGLLAFDIGREYGKYIKDPSSITMETLAQRPKSRNFLDHYMIHLVHSTPDGKKRAAQDNGQRLIKIVENLDRKDVDRVPELKIIGGRNENTLNSGVRVEAIYALGRIGTQEAKEALYLLASDKGSTEYHREKALKQLQNLDAGLAMRLLPPEETENDLIALIAKNDSNRAASFVLRNKDKPFIHAYETEMQLKRMFHESLSESAVYYPTSAGCSVRTQFTLAHAYRALDPAEANAASYTIGGLCFNPATKQILRGE